MEKLRTPALEIQCEHAPPIASSAVPGTSKVTRRADRMPMLRSYCKKSDTKTKRHLTLGVLGVCYFYCPDGTRAVSRLPNSSSRCQHQHQMSASAPDVSSSVVNHASTHKFRSTEVEFPGWCFPNSSHMRLQTDFFRKWRPSSPGGVISYYLKIPPLLHLPHICLLVGVFLVSFLLAVTKCPTGAA